MRYVRFELQRERSSTSGSVEEPKVKETTAEQDGKVMHWQKNLEISKYEKEKELNIWS